MKMSYASKTESHCFPVMISIISGNILRYCNTIQPLLNVVGMFFMKPIIYVLIVVNCLCTRTSVSISRQCLTE